MNNAGSSRDKAMNVFSMLEQWARINLIQKNYIKYNILNKENMRNVWIIL